MEWLRLKRSVINTLQENVLKSMLERIVFEANINIEDVAARMFDEPQGYELEEKGLWITFVQSCLNIAMLGILAQNSQPFDKFSIEPDGDRDYSVAYNAALTSTNMSPDIDKLWKYIFEARSLAGEVVEQNIELDWQLLRENGAYLESHTYLYNSEINSIFKTFPSRQADIIELEDKFTKLDKSQQTDAAYRLEHLYRYQNVWYVFEYALKNDLDWFSLTSL